MAIKLIANYSKRLGLPGYSSHQFSVSVETELTTTDDIAAESARLYQLLQSNVDEQMLRTGFVPPINYGMEDAANPSQLPQPQANGSVTPIHGNGPWRCSDKQKDLILNLVDEHSLDKNEIDHLARQRFGKGVKQLNKLEASGLIDELLDAYGGGSRSNCRQRQHQPPQRLRLPRAWQRTKGGRMIAPPPDPPDPPSALSPSFTTGLASWVQTLPQHISPTAAKSYLGCSLRFWFERVACIRKSPPRRSTSARRCMQPCRRSISPDGAVATIRWRPRWPPMRKSSSASNARMVRCTSRMRPSARNAAATACA
jgi:hypothetical protein